MDAGALLFGVADLAPDAVLAGMAGTMAGGRPVAVGAGRTFGLLGVLSALPEACATLMAGLARVVATGEAMRLDSVRVPELLSAAAGRLQAAAVVTSSAAGMARKVRVFMRKTSSSS